MKQFIALFSLLLTVQLGTGTAHAQDGSTSIQAKAKKQTKMYKAKLGLDTAQEAKFESLLVSYMKKKAKVKKLNISDGDRKVMIKQLLVQENEDMAELLSKGQYKKYLKAKAVD